jgi:hypothetical protein
MTLIVAARFSFPERFHVLFIKLAMDDAEARLVKHITTGTTGFDVDVYVGMVASRGPR